MTAGFHVIGDAAVSAVVAAFERVVDDLGVAAVARCGHRVEHLEMVTADQAAKLGAWGVMASMQPNFDALWGGDRRHVRAPSRRRPSRVSQPVCAVSIPRRGPRVRIRRPGNRPRPVGDRPRRCQPPHAGQLGLRCERRLPRRPAAAGGPAASGDGLIGTLVPGAPASYAVWDVGDTRRRTSAQPDAVRRWSTDPRSRVPALPRLGPTDALPRCRQTVHRGAVIYG